MHTKCTTKTDNFKLVNKLDDDRYIIHYNAIKLVEDEKKFKNSAFVKTGRKIPTGFTESWALITSSKPSIFKIVELITNDINKIVAEKILNGMKWNGYTVWLTSENQKNYADWYNLAINEESIPTLTAKFTKNNKNVYYEFSNKDEIKSLYIGMVKHINDTVNWGRKMKDNINIDEYKKYLNKL
jgi:hypothetical protein